MTESKDELRKVIIKEEIVATKDEYTCNVYHEGSKIGTLYCGYPQDMAKGYSFDAVRESPTKTQLIFYKEV